MPQVSQRYLNGIKEGRESFNLFRDICIGLPPAGLLAHVQKQAADLQSFRDQMSAVAYSAENIEYVDGQIDFMKNQAKRLAVVCS